MNITGIQTLINTDLLNKTPQAIVDAWKVGQLVNATAISSQKNGQATINVNGALLLAQTRFALQPGQSLQLEVSRLSTPTILKIINNTNAPPITLSLQAQSNLPAQWKTGQRLNAVLTPPDKTNQTRTILELAGNRINAQISQALPGNMSQNIKLEVITPGAIAVLKIIAAPPATSIDNTNISQALRTTLPQQMPLPILLGNLTFIVKNHSTIISSATQATPQRITTLPQSLIERVHAVINSLPDTGNIRDGNGLKQAVAQSGLFMESRLMHILQQPTTGITMPPVDFKGGLLSLLLTLLNLNKNMPPAPTSATSTPNAAHNAVPNAQTSTQVILNSQMNLQQVLTELLRNVGSGLARLQLSQLVSSTPEEDGKRAWVMELPVRNGEHIDLIQLRIKKEKNQNSPKKSTLWTVTLALELHEIGPIQVRIALKNKTVSTYFWAKNSDTTTLINQHLTILETCYRKVGLTVGALKVHHGTAPEPVSPDANLPHILLDEKA